MALSIGQFCLNPCARLTLRRPLANLARILQPLFSELLPHPEHPGKLFETNKKQLGDIKNIGTADFSGVVPDRNLLNPITGIMSPNDKLGGKERHVLNLGSNFFYDLSSKQAEACVHVVVWDTEASPHKLVIAPR
jgi:hypothetical protein